MRNFKKAIASVSVAALGVAALAGCTSTPKASSMFDVMKAASELDKCSYEVSGTVEMGSEVIDFTLFGEYDGNATSMSFKAMADGVKYEVEDALIATDSSIYLNVGAVSTLAGAAEFDLSAYGITGDWVSLDFGEELKTETDADVFLDALDKAYKDVIEEEDGKYEIRISSDEDLQEFVDATINLLNDNAESWSKEIAESSNQYDYEAVIRNVISDLFVDVNKHLDAGMTQDDIDEIIDSAMEDVDFSEMEVDAADVEEMFSEMATELEDAKDELTWEGSELDKISITTYQEDKDYVLEAEMVGMMDGEKMSVKFNTTITKDDKASVNVPDKDVQTVSEVVCGMLDAFGITADNLDEYMDELEDMGGSSLDEDDMFEDMITVQ